MAHFLADGPFTHHPHRTPQTLSSTSIGLSLVPTTAMQWTPYCEDSARQHGSQRSDHPSSLRHIPSARWPPPALFAQPESQQEANTFVDARYEQPQHPSDAQDPKYQASSSRTLTSASWYTHSQVGYRFLSHRAQSPEFQVTSQPGNTQEDRGPDPTYVQVNSTRDPVNYSAVADCTAAPKAKIYDEGSQSRQTSVPVSLSIVTTSSPEPILVKTEPDEQDNRFILELAPTFGSDGQDSSSATSSRWAVLANNLRSQAFAPPTEVPLRATQATAEMRRMMGVFRLNPFTMHNFGLDGDSVEGEITSSPHPDAPSWCGGEPRPLDEEPVIFEFQLDLVGYGEEGLLETPAGYEAGLRVPVLSAKMEAQLRAFSPSFRLHPEEGDDDPNEYDASSMASSAPFDLRQDGSVEREDEENDHDRHSVAGSSATSFSIQTPYETSPKTFPREHSSQMSLIHGTPAYATDPAHQNMAAYASKIHQEPNVTASFYPSHEPPSIQQAETNISLLSTPTHHSQPSFSATTGQDAQFAQNQQMYNVARSLVQPSAAGTPPIPIPIVAGFNHPRQHSPSYMRYNRQDVSQDPSDDGLERRVAMYPPSEMVQTMPTVIPVIQQHQHPQAAGAPVEMVGVAGRRWSVPGLGVNFIQGPFLNGM